MNVFRRAMWRRALRKVAGDCGAEFMEYALLGALVAIGVTIGAIFFKDKLVGLFQGMGDEVEAVTDSQKVGDEGYSGD